MATSLPQQRVLRGLAVGNDLLVVLGVILIVIMMVLPLPPVMLDILGGEPAVAVNPAFDHERQSRCSFRCSHPCCWSLLSFD